MRGSAYRYATDWPVGFRELATKRYEARQVKDYVLADQLRQQILALGFDICDGQERTEYLAPTRLIYQERSDKELSEEGRKHYLSAHGHFTGDGLLARIERWWESWRILKPRILNQGK